MLAPGYARFILGGLAVALLAAVMVGLVAGEWGLLAITGTISFFAIVILFWLDTPPGGFDGYSG